MSRAGRKPQGKARYTLTLDPKLEEEARKLDSNFSGFMEKAGWREVKRQNQSARRKPKQDRP
jgi:post-segregation antitoxin (ccd killing protein)